MRSRPDLGRAAAATALLVAGLAPLAARATPAAIPFAPHRAVYDVALEKSTPGSGIADLSGRMVYEFTGNACEGYAQRFRYVTVSTDHEGAKRTGDLRSTSWEDGAGRALRFTTNNYQDSELASATEGRAGRARPSAPTEIELTKPAKRTLSFAPDVYFPVQHSVALLEAARAGRTVFAADLYDGSEKGDKISHTTAVIGRESPPGAVKSPSALSNGDKLGGLSSWPVSIGFFDSSQAKGDEVPTAEQSYRYYANGVSTDLVSDFGDYALRFDLTELTYLESKECLSRGP